MPPDIKQFLSDPEPEGSADSEPTLTESGPESAGDTEDRASQQRTLDDDGSDSPTEDAQHDPSAVDGETSTEAEDAPVEETESDEGQESVDTEADGDEPEAQDADDDTSDESDDGDSFFIKGKHSEYRDPESAKEGLDRKDEIIFEQKDKLSEFDQKLQEREQRLQQYEQQLSEYREVATDNLVEERIQQHLPEEYQGKSMEDFANDEDAQVAFKKARINARAEVESELEQKEKEQERQKEAMEEAEQRAQEFVDKTATYDFFGANPEDYDKVDSALNAEAQGGYTVKDQAKYIAAAFGESAAKRFLTGVRSQIGLTSNQSGRSTSRSSTQKSQKQTKKKKEKVQSKRAPSNTSTPEPQEPPKRSMSPREQIRAGLRSGKRKRQR